MNKKIIMLAIVIAMSAVLAACNSTSGSKDKEQTVVYVGTTGTYNPFSYTDDNGDVTGYDIEVLRLLNEKIPDIKFEFVITEWDAIFLNLDSKKIDIIANQICKNPEREAKYIFSDEGYFYALTRLVVHGDDNERTSLGDFAGETLGGMTDDEFTMIMEEYNEANGNPFKIQYYGGAYTDKFLDLDAKRTAGTVDDTIVVYDMVKSLGLNIKCVGDILESSPSYFVFRDDEVGRDIKAKIDKAMSEVIEDGSLVKLSEEWFEADYTK